MEFIAKPEKIVVDSCEVVGQRILRFLQNALPYCFSKGVVKNTNAAPLHLEGRLLWHEIKRDRKNHIDGKHLRSFHPVRLAIICNKAQEPHGNPDRDHFQIRK
jgi:hypothetical protein